jgi:zinc protease
MYRKVQLMPLSRRSIHAAFCLVILMLAESMTALSAQAAPRVSEFRLSNGMDVVVIPDRRAPVVTHMVWYRVGAADEPRGVSGIAHFLEHLMFKSTDKIPVGEFSKIVARLGGQDNAFTTHDATAYFQRVARERLRTVMEMEADRMVNLKLDEKEVLTERDVILEERRSRIENSPAAILDEQMSAALFQNHPYGIPIIGWMHEMAKLSRSDALSFYKQYYAPNNAILVVSGDVEPDEIRTMAEQIFGPIKANPALLKRQRVQEPQHRAPRRVELKDPRAGRTTVSRAYLAPSYNTSEPGEAEALDLLMKIVAGGATSRLYQKLVVEQKVASSAGGYYSGSGLDYGKIMLSAAVADGATIEQVEKGFEAVLGEVMRDGVTAEELDRAKKAYIAEFIYETDNQMTLARRYGWGMASGRTIAQIDAWPSDISKVTLDQLKAAANKHFVLARSVTGTLIPVAAESPPVAGTNAQPARRS